MEFDLFDGPVYEDDLIADVVRDFPEVVPYLADLGMHCLGCRSAMGETVREACEAHRINTVRTVLEMNRIITGD